MLVKHIHPAMFTLPKVIYAAWVGYEYTVTQIAPSRYVLTSQNKSIKEFSQEDEARSAWEQEVHEMIGWQKFYSHKPLYNLEDCDNESQRQGWQQAFEAFNYQLVWEREDTYDTHTCWMG